MDHIDLNLSSLLFFAESEENSFYEDTAPSEQVKVSGVLIAGVELSDSDKFILTNSFS